VLNIQFIKVPFVSSVTIDDYVEALMMGVSPSGEYLEGRYAVDSFTGYLTGFNSFFSGSGYWLASGSSYDLSNYFVAPFSDYSSGITRNSSLNGNYLFQGFGTQTGTTTGNLYLIQSYQQDAFTGYATGLYGGSFLQNGKTFLGYNEFNGYTTGNTFPYVVQYNNSGSLNQNWTVTYSPAVTTETAPFGGAKSYVAGSTGYSYTPYSPSFLLGNYTAEMWINIRETGYTQYPYFFGNDSAYTFVSGFSARFIPSVGGTAQRLLYSNRGAAIEYTGVSANTWAHIAVSRYTGDPTNAANSGSMNIFYNGAQVVSSDRFSALSLTGRLYSQFSTAIGISVAEPLDSRYFISGLWSEFRLWNYARSSTEIQSTMSTKINPSAQTGLLLYLSL